MHEFRRDLPIYALIAANALPAVGVLFYGWQAQDTLLLYWAENLVVGFYALLRMSLANGPWLLKAALMPFFVVHFGMFTFIHGVFVSLLAFGPGRLSDGPPSLLSTFDMAMTIAPWAVLALFLSHGVSFVVTYLSGGEMGRTDVKTEMERPYRRIMIMHFTILAAFFLMAFGSAATGWGNGRASGPLTPLALIVVKLLVDLQAHRRVHLGIVPLTPFGYIMKLFKRR